MSMRSETAVEESERPNYIIKWLKLWDKQTYKDRRRLEIRFSKMASALINHAYIPQYQ